MVPAQGRDGVDEASSHPEPSGPIGAAFYLRAGMVASAAIAADHGAHGVVRAEILRAVDIEQGGEL